MFSNDSHLSRVTEKVSVVEPSRVYGWGGARDVTISASQSYKLPQVETVRASLVHYHNLPTEPLPKKGR